MVGVEFRSGNYDADKELVSKIQAECLAENMLILSCGTYGNVIRWIPPLVVSQAQIEDGLSRFEKALNRATV